MPIVPATPKAWQNLTAGGTKLNADALIDLEVRLKNNLLNIEDYGASGSSNYTTAVSGLTDNTTAIQAAVDDVVPRGARGIFIPPKRFRTDGQVALSRTCDVFGAGWEDEGDVASAGSVLDATNGSFNNNTYRPTLRYSHVNGQIEINGIALTGRTGTAAGFEDGGSFGGSVGIGLDSGANKVKVSGVRMFAFHTALLLSGAKIITIEQVATTLSKSHGLMCYGICEDVIASGHFGTAGATAVLGSLTPANVSLLPEVGNPTAKPKNCTFILNLVDETISSQGGVGYWSSVRIDGARDCYFRIGQIHPQNQASAGGIGLRLGQYAQRVHVEGPLIEPYTPAAVDACIQIDAGATDNILENIITNPSGGGTRIRDAGTRTKYINVDGFTSVPTKAGAPLAADFGPSLTGIVRGPIYDTTNNTLSFLMADGTTVKKTATLT